ncbi:Uncharacterized protein Adt_42363 [Abeliophyllum distichum]|uniref:Uncharacterized protein n=1 Tax=Abeliophyllum distichum TaxID=126358 RepID=A0ABD1PRG3_9LAMI
MLVDDGSTVNILFDSAFNQMEVDHEVTAIFDPLFGFTGDSLIPRGWMTLAVDFGEPRVPHQEIHRIPDSGHPLRLPRSPRKARVEGSARRSHSYTTDNKIPYIERDRQGFVGIKRRQGTCYMNALRKVAKREDIAPL